jgi:hypothetical protein
MVDEGFIEIIFKEEYGISHGRAICMECVKTIFHTPGTHFWKPHPSVPPCL